MQLREHVPEASHDWGAVYHVAPPGRNSGCSMLNTVGSPRNASPCDPLRREGPWFSDNAEAGGGSTSRGAGPARIGTPLLPSGGLYRFDSGSTALRDRRLEIGFKDAEQARFHGDGCHRRVADGHALG